MTESLHQPDPQVPPPPAPPPGWIGPPPTLRFPLRRQQPPYEGRARTLVRVELVAMAFATAAPGLVIGLRGVNDPQQVDTGIDVLTLVAGILAAFGPVALVWYLLWRDGAVQAAGFVKTTVGRVLGWGSVGYLCCLGAVFSAGVVITTFLFAIGRDPVGQQTETGLRGHLPPIELTIASMVTVLLIAFTAGVTEEAVYRGYAITRMEQAGWPRAALFAPWALWTAQHLYQGPIAIFVVGAVGAPLVWLFWWRRSVWPVMVAHAMYDITIFLVNTSGLV